MTEAAHGAPPLTVHFDTRVFGLPLIQKACLKFSAAAAFAFALESDHILRVEVTPTGAFEFGAEAFTAQLHNEVLDQSLRETVARETEKERDLILAYAFSNTKLIGA
jgi:His-Xaa-Ser system protein HxsD